MTGQGAAPEVGKDGSLGTIHGCAGSAEDASGSRAGQVASLLVCQANPKDDGAGQQAVSSPGPDLGQLALPQARDRQECLGSWTSL